MTKKYRELFTFIIFMSILFIFGCNNEEGINQIDFNLIASEKTLPRNFDEIAFEGNTSSPQYLVKKVINPSEYDKKWEIYGLSNNKPTIDFDNSDVVFVGVQESGNCPYELENKNIKILAKNQAIEVTLPKQYGACFLSATPRTFVIEINKKISDKIKKAVIVDEHGLETAIPLEIQSPK